MPENSDALFGGPGGAHFDAADQGSGGHGEYRDDHRGDIGEGHGLGRDAQLRADQRRYLVEQGHGHGPPADDQRIGKQILQTTVDAYRKLVAAAPPQSQGFILVGALFIIPFILMYTAWSYYVFRGKVTEEDGYH